MESCYKEVFDAAVVKDTNKKLYRMEFDGVTPKYTKVKRIPPIKEYIEESLEIKLAGKYLAYFFTENFEPDGIFSNTAVLCEDGHYYIYNEHSNVPKYVMPISDWDSDEYPKSLEDCIEVEINE